MNREEELHRQVVDYLRLQYPSVMFRTDMGGIRLTPGLRAKAKRLQGGRAWPDLFIAEPREWTLRAKVDPEKNWYQFRAAGLFIELKREGTKLFKKDGSIVSNPHYKEQAEVLQKLREKGYKAEFAVGFPQAQQIIDEYLRISS